MKSVIALSLLVSIVWLISGCSNTDVTDPASEPNNAPILTISSPLNDQVFIEGDDVTLAGSGQDEEDGTLDPDSLVWSSDIDGIIGRGANFAVQNLSVSEHLIILCGTDRRRECGYDTASISVIETPAPLTITTGIPPQGYTCAPYGMTVSAEGGVPPYTWSLSNSSSLPYGLNFGVDGTIWGIRETTGEHTFSVVCTDDAPSPSSDTAEITLRFDIPENPSISIWYDDAATVCGGETAAFTPLDCYVFIMLDVDGDQDCAFATEFQVTMENQNGTPLVLGTQYTHSYVTYPEVVVLTMGDPFNGVAISFSREMYAAYGTEIHVATFGLLLLEDLDNLAFRVGPSPSSQNTRPTITTCDAQHSIVEVDGRASALNYHSTD